jgi:hypothetical protein
VIYPRKRQRWTAPRACVVAALALATMAAGPPLAATRAPEIEVPQPAPRATYQVQRATATIVVDGDLGEWTGSPTFELAYESDPGENIPAPMKTEVWITYDDDRIYVAFKAHDPEPHSIRARFTDRDRAFQDDFVGIVFDTFNDERRAFEFFVNPLSERD